MLLNKTVKKSVFLTFIFSACFIFVSPAHDAAAGPYFLKKKTENAVVEETEKKSEDNLAVEPDDEIEVEEETMSTDTVTEAVPQQPGEAAVPFDAPLAVCTKEDQKAVAEIGKKLDILQKKTLMRDDKSAKTALDFFEKPENIAYMSELFARCPELTQKVVAN